MLVIASLLPFASIFVLLVFRVTTFRAALAGLFATIVAMLWQFPVAGSALFDAAYQWWSIILEVLLILLGGLWLNQILDRIQAHQKIAEQVSAVTGTGLSSVLLVTHGIAPFAESVTGFGVGALIAIPLLKHLGHTPRNAAVLGLLGLVTVPWGSMGPGTLIAAEMTGVGFNELGVLSAVLSVIPFVVTGCIAVIITGAGWRGFVAAIAVALMLAAGILLANLTLSTPPAGALGALASIVVQLSVRRRRVVTENITRWLLPYIVLLSGVLTINICQRLFPSTLLQWLGSPALWLFVACATALLLFKRNQLFGATVITAVKAWRIIGPTTALFVVIGVLLSLSGIAQFLATGFTALGPWYGLVAPILGGVAGVVTGSNSGANAMLASTQSAAAQLAGTPHNLTIAAHNVSTSLGTMANPARIELAANIAQTKADTQLYRPILLCNLIVAMALGVTVLIYQSVL